MPCQPVLSQRGRKWPNLPLNGIIQLVWTLRRKAEVQPRTDRQTVADRKNPTKNRKPLGRAGDMHGGTS